MFVDDAGGASGVTCWAGVAQPQASSVDVAGCRLHDWAGLARPNGYRSVYTAHEAAYRQRPGYT